MTELEKKPKNKKTMSSVATFIVVIAVIIALGTAIFMLFRGKETHISTNTTETVVKLLVCNSTNPKNPFFVSETAEVFNHELKVTYRDGVADKIAYVYDGVYGSNDLANKAESALHANYNIYMSENGVSQENLYPTFSAVENRLKISLYTDYKKISSVTAKLFFINMEEFYDINSYSAEELGKFYAEKGFSCEIGK